MDQQIDHLSFIYLAAMASAGKGGGGGVEGGGTAPTTSTSATNAKGKGKGKGKKGSAATTPSVRDCANCGAPEGSIPGIKKHSACSKCQITFYCSTKWQKQYWKTGGHKQHCVKKEDRCVPGDSSGSASSDGGGGGGAGG